MTAVDRDKDVDERTSRKVAEQARETRWRQPSFGKELFLGHFRLDLIHPHPSGSAEGRERGETFLAPGRDHAPTRSARVAPNSVRARGLPDGLPR